MGRNISFVREPMQIAVDRVVKLKLEEGNLHEACVAAKLGASKRSAIKLAEAAIEEGDESAAYLGAKLSGSRPTIDKVFSELGRPGDPHWALSVAKLGVSENHVDFLVKLLLHEDQATVVDFAPYASIRVRRKVLKAYIASKAEIKSADTHWIMKMVRIDGLKTDGLSGVILTAISKGFYDLAEKIKDHRSDRSYTALEAKMLKSSKRNDAKRHQGAEQVASTIAQASGGDTAEPGPDDDSSGLLRGIPMASVGDDMGARLDPDGRQ